MNTDAYIKRIRIQKVAQIYCKVSGFPARNIRNSTLRIWSMCPTRVFRTGNARFRRRRGYRPGISTILHAIIHIHKKQALGRKSRKALEKSHTQWKTGMVYTLPQPFNYLEGQSWMYQPGLQVTRPMMINEARNDADETFD